MVHRMMVRVLVVAVSGLVFVGSALAADSRDMPENSVAVQGWRLQDAAKVEGAGRDVSSLSYDAGSWFPATVPGTVLTTLVDNHVYAEPLYGDNNRPEKIPESLARTSYWYRTVVEIPRVDRERHIWLNFDGINYAAEVWIGGSQIGSMRGAFARGIFDISKFVTPGKRAAIAVLIAPQPHPGISHEHTLRNGVGLNGGITAMDGPTFLSTIGWDWLPAIRDRDAGIWRKVFLSTSGPVLIKDPLVTTDVSLPGLEAAEVGIRATLENVTEQPQSGVLRGKIEGIAFEQAVTLGAHGRQEVSFDSKGAAGLHIKAPRLWWPNGYGGQELYKLHLSFDLDAARRGGSSDVKEVSFGIRKITYAVPDSENLTISVNGVRVFIRGGNWGLDEALKRIPRERLEAEIRMHHLANLNMIRNWVGQSTNEDFYELCDKYGLLIWDEFFQPNPSDGPNPADLATYLANVREKLVRFRNHPSIAVWCARNEGYPPKEIDDALRLLLKELEPARLYQPSSTDGRGVHSAGPYHWRTPREFYLVDAAFKTEIGSVSVPTLESIHGMMPSKDWERITDDWAERDFAKGASGGDVYPGIITSRYGAIRNLPDFVRKSQMANYEAFRAMYEGRNAQMFHPTTGVLTWMSHPAQPSFVWQLYHYDLEPNASLFAVKKASEMVHIQLNEATGELQVINNLPVSQTGMVAHVSLYNSDGTKVTGQDFKVEAKGSAVTSLGAIDLVSSLSPVYFASLELRNSVDQLVSENFYWHADQWHPDDLTDLEKMPKVQLDMQGTRKDEGGVTTLSIEVHNSTKDIALMTHFQVHRQSGARVLPVFYSDNYISLLPDQKKTITIEMATKDLMVERALVLVDGWNVSVTAAAYTGVSIAPNQDAEVNNSPQSGLPFQTTGLR